MDVVHHEEITAAFSRAVPMDADAVDPGNRSVA